MQQNTSLYFLKLGHSYKWWWVQNITLCDDWIKWLDLLKTAACFRIISHHTMSSFTRRNSGHLFITIFFICTFEKVFKRVDTIHFLTKHSIHFFACVCGVVFLSFFFYHAQQAFFFQFSELDITELDIIAIQTLPCKWSSNHLCWKINRLIIPRDPFSPLSLKMRTILYISCYRLVHGSLRKQFIYKESSVWP